jgi:hypothetical protein
MTDSPSNTCESCGLSFFYDPKFHECADPAVIAALPRTTWVEECMTKQYGGESAQILRRVTANQRVVWSPETGWTD